MVEPKDDKDHPDNQGGQGKNDHPKDKDKKDLGQDVKPPSKPEPGQDKPTLEDQYKHLQADYTKKSGTLKDLHTEMAEYGYEPGEEKLFFDAVKAVIAKAKTGADEGSGEGDDLGGGGDDLTEGEKQIKALGKVTLQTARRVQWQEYKSEMEKQGREVSPELKQKLDTRLSKILRDVPALLTDEKNWYGTAMVLLADGDKDFINQIEQDAVKREKERLEKVGADGKPLDGGAPAGGKSKTVEEELKEKLG